MVLRTIVAWAGGGPRVPFGMMHSEKRRRETGDRNRSEDLLVRALGCRGMGVSWIFLVDGVGAGRRLNLTARLRAKFAAMHESGSGTNSPWHCDLRSGLARNLSFPRRGKITRTGLG